MATHDIDTSPQQPDVNEDSLVKRQKVRHSGGEYVLFSCFDDPEKYVEANIEMLESFKCRLSSVVKHTEPCVLPDGRTFWRAGMTRGMLITMIRSLTLGELVVSKEVTVSEALVALEYEGVNVGGNAPKPTVEHPRPGVGFSKQMETSREALVSVCSRVADAILQWPCMETAMDSALGSLFVTKEDHKGEGFGWLPKKPQIDVSVTSERAWVRFADRPKMGVYSREESDKRCNHLLCENPRWFMESVIAVGIIHHKLSIKLGDDFAKTKNWKNFKLLVQEIEADPLGPFFCVRVDMSKMTCDTKARKELLKGERFLSDIRQPIIDWMKNTASDSSARPNMAVQYSRSIVTLVDQIMHQMPVCARIFSAACSDTNGTTPERTELKKALKVRGVTVIRWSEERVPNVKPLVFPPNWRETTRDNERYGPSVLLSFHKLR